jgi:ribosome-associated protein
MDIRKLQRVIVDGLEDVKAQNILVFNTEHLSALFERVIIASGTSNRQTKSLASSVREAVKSAGYPVPRTEGESNGEWIIIDCGAAVVHVMQPQIRDYYHLEEIWGDKPVSMKLASATTRLVKAAEPEEAVRKPAAKKAAAKKTAARAPARNAAPVKAAPARKALAPTPAAAKKAPVRAAPTRAPATAAKAPAKKVAAKKAPAQHVVTRVVGVKKAPAKKAAAPAKRAAAPTKKAAAPAKKVARKA